MNELETAPVEAPAPPAAEPIHPDQLVSIEHNGIELTGAGETEASLREGLPAEKAEPSQPAKPTKGRQRYSELTSERDQERQKREAAEAKAAELERKLASLSAAPPSTAPVREAPAPVSTAAPVSAPKFTFPTYDQAAAQNPNLSWDDWNDEKIAARARWEYQQSQSDIQAQIRQGIEADRAQRAVADSLEKIYQRGRQAYPTDFDVMIKSGPGAMIPLARTREQADARYSAIVNHPHSEHLQYAIGSNAALATRLGQMSDVEFGQALALIAPGAPAAVPASTGASVVSIAPPPLQPVGSGSKTTVASSVDLAERGGEDYDSSGFREQLRRERRR